MTALRYDTLFEQGATFRDGFIWSTFPEEIVADGFHLFQGRGSACALCGLPEDDPLHEGDPVDLTGRTAKMQVRSSYRSDVVLLELSTENGGITLGGTAGTVDRLITAAQTSALPARGCVYDLELYSPGGGDTDRFLEGSIGTELPEVTR